MRQLSISPDTTLTVGCTLEKAKHFVGGFFQAVVSYMYSYLSDSVPGLPANFLLEYSAFQQCVLMIHKLILMCFARVVMNE